MVILALILNFDSKWNMKTSYWEKERKTYIQVTEWLGIQIATATKQNAKITRNIKQRIEQYFSIQFAVYAAKKFTRFPAYRVITYYIYIVDANYFQVRLISCIKARCVAPYYMAFGIKKIGRQLDVSSVSCKI